MPDKLPLRPDVLVARRAADAWGVLSLDELFACGPVAGRRLRPGAQRPPAPDPSRRLRRRPRQADVLARHRRRRGSTKLAGIIATGPAPTRSELEDVVLDLMLRAGHVHRDVNVPYFVAGRRTVPDFRWPEQRLVVEADSAKWHDKQLAREDDAERQALLEAHGERVLRVTWKQAIARPGPTLARLLAAGAPYTERPMISTNQLGKVR